MWYVMIIFLIAFVLFGSLIYKKDRNGWLFELCLKSDRLKFRIPILSLYGKKVVK